MPPLDALSRTPLLWRIAGADPDILRECPNADQTFIQHLGISLLAAFAFVFTIATVSFLVAFPSLTGAAAVLAPAFGLLVALTILLVDRLFIQSDWDWQANQQRLALAKTTWEDASPNGEIEALSRDFSLPRRIGRWAPRVATVASRIALSGAIGLTVASFLELVIYHDEIVPVIQRLHYEDNKSIYDEINSIKSTLDAEISHARDERDHLQSSMNELNTQINLLTTRAPPTPSDAQISSIESKLASLQAELAAEQKRGQGYAEDMIAERNGTILKEGNTGIPGVGQRFNTARELKALSDQRASDIQSQIASATADRTRFANLRASDLNAATAQAQAARKDLQSRASVVAGELEKARDTLSALELGRDGALATATLALKARPSFLPISFGIASEFRALRQIYETYGSTFEKIMIKLLIMMLEMAPVLQKLLMSPSTVYSVLLDNTKRRRAYECFDDELTLRQHYVRRKASAALGETLDGRGIGQARRDNITKLNENRGAA